MEIQPQNFRGVSDKMADVALLDFFSLFQYCNFFVYESSFIFTENSVLSLPCSDISFSKFHYLLPAFIFFY